MVLKNKRIIILTDEWIINSPPLFPWTLQRKNVFQAPCNAFAVIPQNLIFDLAGIKHLSAWCEDFDRVSIDILSGSPWRNSGNQVASVTVLHKCLWNQHRCTHITHLIKTWAGKLVVAKWYSWSHRTYLRRISS